MWAASQHEWNAMKHIFSIIHAMPSENAVNDHTHYLNGSSSRTECRLHGICINVSLFISRHEATPRRGSVGCLVSLSFTLVTPEGQVSGQVMAVLCSDDESEAYVRSMRAPCRCLMMWGMMPWCACKHQTVKEHASHMHERLQAARFATRHTMPEQERQARLNERWVLLPDD